MADAKEAEREAELLHFKNNEAIKAADKLALAKDQLAKAQEAVAAAEAEVGRTGGVAKPAASGTPASTESAKVVGAVRKA